MKRLLILVLPFVALATCGAPAHANEDGQWETVFVPEGKQVRIVDPRTPKQCITLMRWQVMHPDIQDDPAPAPEEPPLDCDKLVVSPNVPDPRCAAQ